MLGLLAPLLLGFGSHPHPHSRPTVYAVVSAVERTETYYETTPFFYLWKKGAEAAAANLVWWPYAESNVNTSLIGYPLTDTVILLHADRAVAGINEACDKGDALVVDISFYAGSAQYVAVDDALNSCLEKRPDFPIFSAASDTYRNVNLYGYVGPESYQMGRKCARWLLFKTHVDDGAEAGEDAVSGRNQPPTEPVPEFYERCPNGECQVLQTAFAETDAAYRLMAGLTDGLAEYNGTVARINPNMSQLYYQRVGVGCNFGEPCPLPDGFVTVIESYVISSFQARSVLSCGFVIDYLDNAAVGVSPFRQGLLAVAQAEAAARLAPDEWLSAKGNNEAGVDPNSIRDPSRPEVYDTAVAQTYDEPEAQFAQVLAWAAYAEPTAGGGSIQSRIESTCTREAFPEWDLSAPVSQFYWKGGDIMGYVALLKSSSVIFVGFRGTQGISAIANWAQNLDIFTDPVPCPQKSDETSPREGCEVHSGFLESFTSLSPSLVPRVKELLEEYPDARVIVGGHSLGGGIATVAAYDLSSNQGVPVSALYTFGSPRVFNVALRNAFEAFRSFPVWTFCNHEDPVSRIPMDSWGFRHVGVEVYTDSDYAQRICDGSGVDPACGYQHSFALSISDHSHYFTAVGNHGEEGCDTPGAYEESEIPRGGYEYLPDQIDEYGSCDAYCRAVTGNGGQIQGEANWWQLWDCQDHGGDCDKDCLGGHCRAAPESFPEYGTTCRFGTKICCCSDHLPGVTFDIENRRRARDRMLLGIA